MSSDLQKEQGASDIPSADDGFSEPPDSVKRRNLITAAIILALLTAWILYGLRHAIF